MAQASLSPVDAILNDYGVLQIILFLNPFPLILNCHLSHNIESSDSITAAMLNDNSKLNSDELTL